MTTFIATLAYELHPETEPVAAKLLRAELVGRRWQERSEGESMPRGALWIQRSVPDEHTTDDVHDACGEDLRSAVAAVFRMGKKVGVTRAWVQVSGAGTYGMVQLTSPARPDEPPTGT